VLHTDGVPDARRGREFFGDSRIVDWVRRPWSDAAALTESLLQAVLDFQNGTARDDIAILALRVPAAA
jgi:sigma-B regulation protein RsbU (phosphoserine phosphatase)